MLLLWPRYEQRLFRTCEGAAREWAEKIRERGLTIDDGAKWCGMASACSDYYWADAVRGRARVSVGAEDTRKHPNFGRPLELSPGVYFQVAFRVNAANSALAESVVRALLSEDTECIGRNIRLLGGKVQARLNS